MPKESPMNCYLCEKTRLPQTLRYAIAPAVGICHDCGIGICLEHSVKAAEAGAPLLCPTCAEQRSSLSTMPRVTLRSAQKATA